MAVYTTKNKLFLIKYVSFTKYYKDIGDNMKHQAMLDLYMPSIEVEILRLLKEHSYKIDEASMKSKGKHLILRDGSNVFKINIQGLYRNIFYNEKGDIDISMNDIEYGLLKVAQIIYQYIDVMDVASESIDKMKILSSLYEIKTIKQVDNSYEIY